VGEPRSDYRLFRLRQQGNFVHSKNKRFFLKTGDHSIWLTKEEHRFTPFRLDALCTQRTQTWKPFSLQGKLTPVLSHGQLLEDDQTRITSSGAQGRDKLYAVNHLLFAALTKSVFVF
jgi:hypothetical protein